MGANGIKDMPIDAIGGLSAYAAKVGYKGDAGEDATFIRSVDEWCAYADSMSQSVWDGQGNETRIRPEGFREYGPLFFATGNQLVAIYHDMPSGSLDPTVISCEVTEEGRLSVSIDLGRSQGMMLTMDMSGFVIVVEVPAGTEFDGIDGNLVA